jgi:hypothetical protein
MLVGDVVRNFRVIPQGVGYEIVNDPLYKLKEKPKYAATHAMTGTDLVFSLAQMKAGKRPHCVLCAQRRQLDSFLVCHREHSVHDIIDRLMERKVELNPVAIRKKGAENKVRTK